MKFSRHHKMQQENGCPEQNALEIGMKLQGCSSYDDACAVSPGQSME